MGLWPKRQLVYFAAESVRTEKRVGLDILGHGSQSVFFAIHPVTKRPYEWGERTPLDTPVTDLPAVTQARMDEFLEKTGLPKPAGPDGGMLQPLVHDPETGLVTDGREGWLTLCVWQAASDAPDAAPETWADAAWEHFRTTTYLKRDNKKLTEKEALAKARYLHKRSVNGQVTLADPRLLKNDDPIYVARAFEPELGDGGYWRGDFYRWTGTGWNAIDDEEIRSRLYLWLETRQGKKRLRVTRTLVNDILAALAGLTRLGTGEPPFWIDRRDGDPDPIGLLPFRNGVLDIETGRLLDHDRRLFALHRIDCDYDAQATAPTYERFLEQVLPDGDELPGLESREAIDEFCGYCMSPDTSQQKAALWIGKRRSGRGTICRLLRAVVGADKCANPTLGQFGQQFGREGLIGKTVAMLTDVRGQDRANPHAAVESILTITGEDAQTIQRKYKTDWHGRLSTRIIVVSNIVPKLTDAAGVVPSRFIALEFPVSFEGKEDPDLMAKLMPELPGVVNRWLAGLRRLRERGHFLQPESGEQILELLRARADALGTFLEEMCAINPSYDIEKDVFNTAFNEWLQDQGHYRMAAATIATQLYAHGFSQSRPRRDGGRAQVYRGLTLKQREGVGQTNTKDPEY